MGSVLKWRKKKMNKHKYRKRRKKMRAQRRNK
ncbi:30S ribosomal protein bS22 [Thermodesulfovibrio hydrogeniphilus]